VVGGGNSAAEESLLLTKFADKVFILVRGGAFKATRFIQDKVLAHPKIEVRWHTEVNAFSGARGKLKELKIRNNQTNQTDVLPVDGAFIFIGLTPNTGILKGSDIVLDSWGFIVTGQALKQGRQLSPLFENRDPFLLETSIPGIFAAGDVRDASTKQVVSAAGEGGSAALEIREYLKRV
jgi:thioredoxin reductase (NADPH)